MDLPTYTNIWRIEKRLYKLYDFRLPMPLPVTRLAIFAAIAVPYALALTVLGLPFSHTLLWLYALPPGALAWLATRPVLESKRLPELVISQLRYLGEPRTWCRMSPLTEKDEVTVTCRVWRQAAAADVPVPAQSAALAATAALDDVVVMPDVVPQPAVAEPRPAVVPRAAAAPSPAVVSAVAAAPSPAVVSAPAPAATAAAAPRPAAVGRAAVSHAAVPGSHAPRPAGLGAVAPGPAALSPAVPGPAVPVPAIPRPGTPVPAVSHPAAAAPEPERAVVERPAAPPVVAGSPVPVAPPVVAGPPMAPPAPAGPPAPPARPPAERPVVTVTGEHAAGRPLRVVERALNDSSVHRGDGWRDHVVVVPGGHRPGRPDQPERDRARARLPVAGSRRIVVLGCTVGAGQTMTTLMTGEMLAALRRDPVAVLDLNPGSGSLTERARATPALSRDSVPSGRTAASPRGDGQPAPSSRLEVITRAIADPGEGSAQEDADRMFELVSARYSLTLADPSAAAVPRVLAVADQLVLVAPASADAPSAIAMTQEWLEAHGRASLAAAAIMVLNGVSRHTMRHVEQAEAVASGRCRAIIRVPWDDRLKNPATERLLSPSPGRHQYPGGAGLLSPAAVHAYTALAGVLIAGLAEAPELRTAQI